jgi:ParB-like chromosome segregation protein Spo0J
LRACVEAGVEPRFVAFAGADAFAYVVAANVNRRHLNDGQRALSAARLATLRKGQKASNAAFAVTQTEAAKLFNVSTDTIQRARLILEDGHQGMVEKVNAGTMSINAAYRILRPVRREESSSAALLTKPDNDNESRQGSRAALIRDMEKVRLGAAGIVAMLSSERADVSSDDIVHTVQAIHRISKKWASVLESR